MTHDATDPALQEHMVRVEWLRTRSIEEAVWQPGLFTNQMPACRLRDQETIDYLEQAFGLETDEAGESRSPDIAESLG